MQRGQRARSLKLAPSGSASCVVQQGQVANCAMEYLEERREEGQRVLFHFTAFALLRHHSATG